MVKKGVCELCGFADNSYSIEENGAIIKVCKFCHDGYLERMGFPEGYDAPVKDVTLTLDLEGAEEEADENLQMKVPPLTEEELGKILNSSVEERRMVYRAVNHKNIQEGKRMEKEKTLKASEKENEPTNDKNAKRKQYFDNAVHQRIDDERIKITSPEISLKKDNRPKTNLDVAIAEYQTGVRFIDCFKYVFNRVTYSIFLGLIVLGISTVLFVINGWKDGLIALFGGLGAIILSFFLMWYFSYAISCDRRALLLRIKQQEILFDSMTTHCYRELKTKFTILKALSWLLNKASIILPLVVIVGTVVTAAICTFLVKSWLFSIILGGAIIAAIVVYYIVKFLADIITYMVDVERNQQIAEQTMLDMLSELKKK